MKKERIFDNLFEMTYEPYFVSKKEASASKNVFPTIFAVVNHVEEHSLIKINPGVYEERFNITKPDIKLQASELTENTILINKQFPNIIVDLPEPSDKIILESLKIAHACETTTKDESGEMNHQILKKHTYKSFKTHQGINTCIYIRKGIVQLDECRISLAAYHRKESVTPCIVVEKEGCLILNRSEIKGGAGTIGILCKSGKVMIKQSLITGHGSIGILATGNSHTNISIKNSTFEKCNEAIVLNGPFEAFIENTIINKSTETGIVICTGNRSKIYNNEIKNGESDGIQIKNSVPSILKNSVTCNLRWGVKISSMSGVICKASLKFNTISENNMGGVIFQGSVNCSSLHNNEINFNNKYGVLVENRATPHIFMNKVMKTVGTGIQVMENCSAFLEKNSLDGSLKSNMVLKGPNNICNFVYGNKIVNSRGEGIFLAHCEKFSIRNNQITGNYNGIVSMTGVENIEENRIQENERNGILLIRDNNVRIINNQVIANQKAGIFIRDTSVGQISANYFSNNKSQMVVENDQPEFANIEQHNQFGDGDLRIPSNYYCQLI